MVIVSLLSVITDSQPVQKAASCFILGTISVNRSLYLFYLTFNFSEFHASLSLQLLFEIK